MGTLVRVGRGSSPPSALSPCRVSLSAPASLDRSQGGVYQHFGDLGISCHSTTVSTALESPPKFIVVLLFLDDDGLFRLRDMVVEKQRPTVLDGPFAHA